MSKAIKVGVDLDGTITENPLLFSILTNAVLQAGGEVHIITFRDNDPTSENEVIKELEELEIPYTKIHLPEGNKTKMGPWKAKLASQLNLNAIFEDQPEVLELIDPNITKLWVCNFYDLPKIIKSLK